MQLKARHTANLIRNRRTDLKLSQVQLQAKLGLKTKHAAYLSNIERGLNPFPIKYINQLSCALNVSREMIVEIMARDYKEQILEEIKKV